LADLVSLGCPVFEVIVAKRSAGVLIYRFDNGEPAVLLVHPGGPYWRAKDVGAWQIPKGMIENGEELASAARREAEEELGVVLTGDLFPLGVVRQAGGKLVEAFAVEQDVDADAIASNMFDLEWPPRSGAIRSFPEVDAARWMSLEEAGRMMIASQRPLLEALAHALEQGKML
jgi:predicted NUDIX family NTP pyrophosphohydrolase